MGPQGLPLPVFGAILENAALFMVYNQIQIGIKKLTGRPGDLSLGEKAVAAAGGGTAASFILCVPFHFLIHKIGLTASKNPFGAD